MGSTTTSMAEGTVVTEILSRLPVKSLMRFKYVCKSWHDLISDPYFLEKHLDHSRKKPQLVVAPFPAAGGLSAIGLYAYGGAGLQARLMLEKEFSRTQRTLGRLQHADGLLLLNTVTDVHVCNPSTGELVTLPGSTNIHAPAYHDERSQRAGFGYVSRDKCYKVARYFYRRLDLCGKTYSLGLEVFELGGDDTCWRVVDEDPPHPIHSLTNPVSIRGVVYFMVDDWLCCTSPPKGILAFDLSDEKFKGIDRPYRFSTFNVHDGIELSELEGRLCFVRTSRNDLELDVWAYKEEEDSWVHACHINLSDPRMYATPIRVSRGKTLFHCVRNGMHSLELYDPQPGLLQTVASTLKDLEFYWLQSPFKFSDEPISFQVIKYVESVAPIKTPTIVSP